MRSKGIVYIDINFQIELLGGHMCIGKEEETRRMLEISHLAAENSNEVLEEFCDEAPIAHDVDQARWKQTERTKPDSYEFRWGK